MKLSSNREYWLERLDKLTNKLMNKEEKDTFKFLKTYKSSLTEIQTYINFLFSKYSTDGILSLSEMYKFNRYQLMEKEITAIVKELDSSEVKYMTGALKETYIASFVETGALFVVVNPKIKIDFGIINKDAVAKALNYPWSGDMFSSRIHKNTSKLITNLRQTITQGFVQGKSISQMSKDLNYVMSVGANNSRRLIRTESMHVIAASHHDVYTKAKVDKVEFVTAKDDRVCNICKPLDGKIFSINEAPMIPLHANSRSILIPVFE